MVGVGLAPPGRRDGYAGGLAARSTIMALGATSIAPPVAPFTVTVLPAGALRPAGASASASRTGLEASPGSAPPAEPPTEPPAATPAVTPAVTPAATPAPAATRAETTPT